METHGVALESNLVQFLDKVETYARQPNTLRWVYEGMAEKKQFMWRFIWQKRCRNSIYEMSGCKDAMSPKG